MLNSNLVFTKIMKMKKKKKRRLYGRLAKKIQEKGKDNIISELNLVDLPYYR